MKHRVEKSHLVFVGERLKAIREDKKMTQQTLQDRSGISRAALSLIEQGKTGCSFDTILRIAYALGVNVAQFARGWKPEEIKG